MSARIDDDDMSRAVAFIDGAMSDDERARFELRLAAEPELASAVEALMRTDELVRRGTARRGAANVVSLAERRPRSPWLWAASLAATILAALAIARWVERERSHEVDCLVALAPSFASPEEFLASRPDLAGLRPPGLGSLRGEAAGTNIGARAFVDKAHALEERASSVREAAAPITAGYFVIPIEARANCSVVVLGFPTSGASTRLFPDPADARPSNALGRVEPGAHTLPRERIELAANGQAPAVAYNRGFLVPVGAREMRVLVAVRKEALDADLVTTIDAALKRGDARESVERSLEERGFRVSELRVIEPKD